MTEDHSSEATIEEEKSDGHLEVHTADQARFMMLNEGDLSNLEFHKWPDILGNEAARQLPDGTI